MKPFGVGQVEAVVISGTAMLQMFRNGDRVTVNAGLPDPQALGTGQRNAAAALVVGSQNFGDPKVVVIVIVIALVGLIILMPLSRALVRRGTTSR